MVNGHTAYVGSYGCGIDVKHSKPFYAAALKHMRCGKSLAEITRADDDRRVALLYSEKLGDLSVKILDVVAVALLTEAPEAVKVLPYLRRRYVHKP